jgi:hypothetical protein
MGEMGKTVKGVGAKRDPKRVNPLLPHGTPTTEDVDEFLDVTAFVITRMIVSPAFLRLVQLGEQLKSGGHA